MRHTILTILFFLPLMTMQAQNWETLQPEQTQKAEVKQEKKTGKDGALKKSMDPKYLAGAVTEKDGKVTWMLDMDAPGKDARQVYDKILQYFIDFTKQDNQLEESHVALVNKAEHSIIVSVREWLVFKQNFIGIDRAKTSYTVQINCSDGKAHVELARVIFDYTENVPGQAGIYRAEEWITDDAALNKKKTKILPGCVKFRTKMIDRKDEIFDSLQKLMK